MRRSQHLVLMIKMISRKSVFHVELTLPILIMKQIYLFLLNNLFSQLNNVSLGYNTIKYSDLEAGKIYTILEIREIDSRYGWSLLGTIKSVTVNQKTVINTLWLPKRYGNILKNEEVIKKFVEGKPKMTYDPDNNNLQFF